MIAPGRNDPCPCGSGRKYKKCCLLRAWRAPAYTREDRERALERLTNHATRKEVREEVGCLRKAFWGECPDLAEVERRLGPDVCREIAFRMLFHIGLDADLNGTTLVADLLHRDGARIPAGERAFLEQAGRSCLRLYRVHDVTPASGMTLEEIGTGVSEWVSERAATGDLVSWDLLAARLLPGLEGGLQMEGDGIVFPHTQLDRILAEWDRAFAAARESAPGADEVSLRKRTGYVYHHLWLSLVAFPPMPQILTPEGDALEVGTSRFEVDDAEAFRSALSRHAAFTEGDGETWLCKEGDRILAHLRWEGEGRLCVESLSRERLGHVRSLLKQAAGDLVRYRSTRYVSPEDAIAQRDAASPSSTIPAEGLPPEVQASLAKQFLDKHYREWPDLPVPALGNRTPRNAARDPRSRRRLVGLLMGFENMEARSAKSGGEPYDFGWLWRELELEHP